jgi:hypothetical protein
MSERARASTHIAHLYSWPKLQNHVITGRLLFFHSAYFYDIKEIHTYRENTVNYLTHLRVALSPPACQTRVKKIK